MRSWKIIDSADPDVVWECRDGEPVSPMLFCGIVWKMKEDKRPTFLTLNRTVYRPEEYDADQLMALADHMISMEGGFPMTVEIDGKPWTRADEAESTKKNVGDDGSAQVVY